MYRLHWARLVLFNPLIEEAIAVKAAAFESLVQTITSPSLENPFDVFLSPLQSV